MSSPTKPTTCIEDLPPEMICALFDHLHPKDLAACSMVNKRWHSIYSNFKLHSLAAMHEEHDLTKWYHSNRPIQEAERCPQFMFLRLAEKPLLSNLKHLALCMYEPDFDLNKLNRFQQLLHLEIHSFPSHQERTHLNLPRLKVLAVPEWNENCPLSIDCPLLSTLLYEGEPEDANLLQVKHPETIRKLETYMDLSQLVPFKNVECLATRLFVAINKSILLTLPRLREFRYIQDIRSVFDEEYPYGVSTLDELKRMLNEFLDGVKKLRGRDFRFTFAGLQVTNVDQIDFGVQVNENGEETVSKEYIYMKNYHLIERDALHFVHYANYPRLLSHANGELPRCFFQKFTDIQWVSALTEVADAGHFLWFMKSLRFPQGLELAKTGLGQAFYDQLPAVAPTLISLHLAVGHCEDGLQLNFDFISRLSRLSRLVILPALSLKSLPSLVRSVARLELARFDVRSREKIFKIDKRISSAEWTIKRDGESLFETEDPEEIVDFFDDLQENTPEREV